MPCMFVADFVLGLCTVCKLAKHFQIVSGLLFCSVLITFNRQLDNVSRSVFKENVRLNEALGYHLKEVDELKRSNKALTEENASLLLDKVQSLLPLALPYKYQHTVFYCLIKACSIELQ